MLQPRQPVPPQPEIVAKILWAALTFSMVIYGFALFVTQKISAVYFPSSYGGIEYAALGANLILFASYAFYKSKVADEKDAQKRLTNSIICWVLNEWIVIMGFVAVFITDSGNGFFYVTNLLVGLVGNVLTFPRK